MKYYPYVLTSFIPSLYIYIYIYIYRRTHLCTGFFRLGKVEVHFVAVEVGVVRRAHTFVKPERPVLENFGRVGHDAHPRLGCK